MQHTQQILQYMITRRNIRVKAFQALYTVVDIDDSNALQVAKKSLTNAYDQATKLLVSQLLVGKLVCEYCLLDSNVRKNKHLPSPEDLIVSIAPSHNCVVTSLVENAFFVNTINELHLAHKWQDDDTIKTLYNLTIQEEFYTNYIALDNPTSKEGISFFRSLLEFLHNNEDAQSKMSDLFIAYDDDITNANAWIFENISKIGTINFDKIIGTDKKEFGMELIDTYFDKKEQNMELIVPKLNNWEPDRVAKSDMILLQCGVNELLYFPNIPAKVTINEYIDIAKEYSTENSGKFVNGILDGIHRDLVKENRIHKTPMPNKKG